MTLIRNGEQNSAFSASASIISSNYKHFSVDVRCQKRMLKLEEMRDQIGDQAITRDNCTTVQDRAGL